MAEGRALLLRLISALAILLCSLPAQAQGPSPSSASGLTEAACFASSQNINASQTIALDCRNLTGAASSGSSGITINCPASCAAAFQGISQGCLNSVASSATLGGPYRLIFNACGVNYSASGAASSPPAASPDAQPPSDTVDVLGSPPPSAGNFSSGLPPAVASDLSGIACLNSTAAKDVASSCANVTVSANGTSLVCPAACGTALGGISQSCINSIANSTDLGSTYQALFDACGVSDSTSGNSSSSGTPTSGGPAAAPTTGGAPTSSGAPTSGGAPTPAPTQAAVRMAAPAGALLALALGVLTLLA